MLLRTIRGDADFRPQSLFEDSSRIPSRNFAGTWAGVRVDRTTVGGLPAVTAAIRLRAETVGMIPLHVLRGLDPEDREKARDTWQWRVLHQEPNRHQSPFDFKQDISTSVNADGNAYIWKVKVLGEVIETEVLDPAICRPVRNKANQKMIRVRVNGESRDYSPATILHIRGWTMQPGADVGLSPIAYHQQGIASGLALKEFEGRFFSNGAQPGGAISIPAASGDLDPDTVQNYRDQWDENHAGLHNSHRPAIFFNGATWQQIGVSLDDAQFIEANSFTIEEIARMFRISSPSMLSAYMNGEVPDVNEEFERFLKVDLAPELSRIETAFARDRDFFPASQDLFPEFLADAVLRPDVKTRYEAYRLARQGGWMAPNEVRALENLPPKEGGDEIQQTPVGGAPNPSSTSDEPSAA